MVLCDDELDVFDVSLIEALRRGDPDGAEQLVEPAVQAGLRGVEIEAIPGAALDDRMAFVLHDVEGASKADIAAILDLDVRAVTAGVHGRRLLVRKRLSEYFEFV